MSYYDIIPLCLTEIVGDTGFKWFANQGGATNLAIGLTGYAGVMYYLVRSLQGSSIIVVNTAWDGVSTLLENAFALFVLGERYEHAMQYVGMALVLLGVYFLKVPWKAAKPFDYRHLLGKGIATPSPTGPK